jgi:hypothetical protein
MVTTVAAAATIMMLTATKTLHGMNTPARRRAASR